MSCDPKLPNIPKNQILTVNTITQREHEDDAAARRSLLVDMCGENFGTPGNPIYVNPNATAADSDPLIFNVPAPLAGTEYSQVIPDNTKALLVRVRDGNGVLQIAFVSGDSSLNYLTVGLGNNLSISGVDLVSKTLYFQVSKPGKVIEILAWL